MHKDKPSIIFQSTNMGTNNNNNGQFKAPMNITPHQMLGNQGSKLTQKVPSMNSMEFKSINLKNSTGGNNSLMQSARMHQQGHHNNNSLSTTRVQNMAASIPNSI